VRRTAKKRWGKGPVSAIGLALLAFLTAAPGTTEGEDAPPAKDPAAGNASTSLEEELKSFEAQLTSFSSAESLFTNGRAPDLVVVTSTDVHGEVEPCG
jgi:hypothetical protein